MATGRADRRLLALADGSRRYLATAIFFGLVTTVLVITQATLLAQVIAGVSEGKPARALSGSLAALALVIGARAASAYGGEAAALYAAARVKSKLRLRLMRHVLALGPSWLSGQRTGELVTLSTRGLDALDVYFARYLPQLMLAVLLPLAVLIRIGTADWLSAVIIAVTLPLIPVFMVLVGSYTRNRTTRQWRLLAQLGGHFLDVIEGLPTLMVFGRAKAQATTIRRITDDYRRTTMATLRVAFLSALVLELLATIATALVAVAVGLRLLDGKLSYQTALLVLLLTPEAYLPLRALGTHYHASMEGIAAGSAAFAVLDEPASAAPNLAGERPPDLLTTAVQFDGVSLHYPDRDSAALDDVSFTIQPGSLVVVIGESGAGKSSPCSRYCSGSPSPPRVISGSVTSASATSHRPTGDVRSPGFPSRRTCSPEACSTTSGSPFPTPGTTRSYARCSRRTSTVSSLRCRTVRRPSSGSVDYVFRLDNVSASPWLAPSSVILRCCCSMSRQPTLTR